MPVTFPKPKLLEPKVPGLLVIGLLAAQFSFFGHGNNVESKCILKVDQPHYSTYLNEYKAIDAIKLNITSTCNVPQRFTEVRSSIFEITNNREVTAYSFPLTRAFPTPKSPQTAVLNGLFAKCEKGKEVSYEGRAKGYVFLRSGQKYPVSGSSGKFVAVLCSISAQ
jgi:hypothetical protein